MSDVPKSLITALQLFASTGHGWEDAFVCLLKRGDVSPRDRPAIRKFFLGLSAVSKRYGT